jgi:ketosteroid isomerase-like protein
MSQENVEIVHQGIAAYNRGDLNALLDIYDPEIEFITLLLGNHQGKEALLTIFEENRRNLSGYRLDPEELIAVNDDNVVAIVRLGGAGRVSEIALGDQIAFLLTMKEGLVVRQQTFRNKDEALEAAGLRD